MQSAITTEEASTTTIHGREFRVPGPGSWELDPVHFPALLTRYLCEIVAEPFAEGFARSTEIYGLTLDTFMPAPQHGVWYHRAVPFGVPPGASGPPTREQFVAATRSPAYAARLERGRRAFESRAWRRELERWDARVKPAAIETHQRLQAEDLRALGDEGLLDHLDRATRQLQAMWVQHHDYTASALLPVGDYLAHAQAWTGLPHGVLLRPLRGSSPVSRGAAASELDGLVEALRGRDEDLGLLDLAPKAALDALCALPAPVGPAAVAWLGVAGHRSVGYDLSEPYALEIPEMLVGTLRARLRDDVRRDEVAAAIAAVTEDVRRLVPSEHLAQFDELLAEARFMNRLRDERGNYSDSWAAGLVRRAILEIGRRLAERATLADATLAIEATRDELRALLRGQGSPSEAELLGHRAWRTGLPADAFPAYLGEPPSGPPPADWMPPESRRLALALEHALAALFAEPETPSADRTRLTGLPVSPGVHEGVARIVRDGRDFSKLRRGDVLVTRATAATFNVVLPLLGAIVTDRGGQLCHAAIVAREAGIPGVVGTRTATSVLRDGDRVRVDGSAGTVTVLS